MANKIVQHRRGTTAEWLEVNLIPAEGELVIEECSDGTYKCKIGNGHTKFTELPYLNTELQNKLIDEIDSLKQDFDKKLTKSVGSFANALIKLDNSLSKKIDDEIEICTTNITTITDELNEHKINFNDVISDITTDYNSKILNSEDKLEKLVEDSKQSQAVELAALRSNLMASLAKSETSTQESLDASNKVLANDISSIDKKYSEAITNLSDDIVKIADKHAEDYDALCTVTSNISKELSKAVANSTEEVTNVKQQLEKDIENSNKLSAKNINVLKEQVETKFATNKLEWLANLSDTKDELIAADNVLTNTIKNLEASGKVFSEDTLSQLNLLRAKTEQLAKSDTTILSNVLLIDNKYDNISKDLVSKLDTLASRHSADYSYINSVIKSLEETINASNLSLNETLLDNITNIYIELADLVDDDILILSNLFLLKRDVELMNNTLSGDIAGLEQRIKDLDAEISDLVESNMNDALTSLSKQIDEVNIALTENIATLRFNTNSKISDNQKAIAELETSIKDIETTINTKIDEVEQNIVSEKEAISESIISISTKVDEANTNISKVDDNLRVQTQRINNIIALPEDTNMPTAELEDIRIGYNGLEHESAGDAVRAIGNDLEELKASLPEYIPSNSVDGLLYENNLLYLTSKGEPVCEPVEITGGSGGGGSISTVRVKNNLASNNFTVAKDNPAVINFTYTSFENEVPTGDGTFVITINNKDIDGLSGSIQHNVPKVLDIAEYLKNGANDITIRCTDQYGVSRSLYYTISVIELRIESSFDSTRIFDDTITFRYKIFGQVEKTVHVFIDDNEISTKILAASVSGNETTLNIPKQKHGSHKITAYISATINGVDILSNVLEYEVICIEDNNNEAILTSICDIKNVSQGDLVSIPYILYDPVKISSEVDLAVYKQVAGELIEVEKTSLVVDRNQQFWKTRKYPVGTAVFVISYTYNLYGVEKTISKSHTITVEELDINVSAEEDGLQLYLSAQGRSNNEQNPAMWSFTQETDSNETYDTITTTFSNFNWKSNGWVDDGTGDTCLRLTGDARAVVNFKPFEKDFKLNGKTIEFEFLVRDVNSRDAIIIDCFDGSRGFRATPDTAFLQSSGTKVSCRYKDEERVRVAVSVEYADSLSRFVSIYLDGTLAGVQRYATTDNFAQDKPLSITLGSNLCGLDIYTIRVYDKALSTPQILNNYIADKTVPTVKQQLVTENDLLDENNKVSYERVKALGNIPIITFTGAMPTYKGDKKKKSVRMKFEDPLNPEMNFDVLLDQIDVQGTSSQFYVRKNWKVKLPEARPHMPGAIPAKVFCIKVDYAEATGTHNTGTANYVESFYDLNEVTLPPQKDDARVRTTIQGFPVVLFEKATEDSEPVFSSKGNFNYDKDAENAFGFTEDYEDFGVECWEFCNNTSDPVNFVGEIPDDWLEDFEPRYVPEDANFELIEELKELEELAASGKATMTETQRQELATYMKNCIANFKEMHDWVLSTATYSLSDGKRIPIVPVALETPITYGETTYTEDNEEYRLAKFKYEFENYFNMHYCCIYYVYTLFALMTDQRAKNLFLTRWKEDDGVYRWYPYFYDNDTIFGINNEGAMVFDYYHEDTDQLGSSNVYNGQNSAFWNNFRICFPQKIQETYSDLRSNKKLTYDALIDAYVTKGSDKWSATIYNEDAEYKYISMARQLTEDGDVDASNLYQVRGKGEHHLRYFVDNRLKYCDGKWYAGDYPSDDIFLRIYTPTTAAITDDMSEEQKEEIRRSNARIEASLAAVPADPSITVTPFSNMYAGVRYKSGTLQQQRVSAGASHTFRPLDPNETFGDTETAIYGASELSSLGDLSGLYCGVISLGNASKLIEVIMGSENPDYHNDNFREISVGSNRLLRKIDLRNCSGLGIAGASPQKTLDLSGCPNIEHIYTEGTNLESVALPEGGYVKTLHLPASTNTIVIRNQRHITDFNVESYNNIRILCLENCPTLNADDILEACKDESGKYTVERVRLTGLDWHFENADFVKSLFPKFDAQGNIISGIRGIDEKNNNLDDAYLVGTCYIEKLTGADYTEIKQHYPYLDIKFGEMTSNVIFKYYDINNNEYTHTVSLTSKNSELGTCEEPILTPEPMWQENDAFAYELVGWSRSKQTSNGLNDHETDYEDFIQADALLNIAGDRILYPVFKALRKSYEVRFVNPTDNNKLLQSIMVPYASDAKYTNDIPLKLDSIAPNIYEFNGWYPSPEKITGALTCYAQFALLDDKWYILNFTDIIDCTDYNGNSFDGYTLNEAKKTMYITECNNSFNAAVRVLGYFDTTNNEFKQDSAENLYTVTQLGGFADHSNLELIDFPETITEIRSRGFNNCYNLFELNLPSSVNTIGSYAFQGCSRLKEIYIPASVVSIGDAAFADCIGLEKLSVDDANTRYVIMQDCLIDTSSKKLIQGLSTGTIPSDGSVTTLGQYCFSNTTIESIEVPESVSTIANNAFSRCANLKEVKLPSTISILDATCFAWCTNLSNVNLPEGLLAIRTYVFDACNLSTVVIPSSVESLLERSFGDMSSLHEVTFKKQLNENGEVVVPYIHKNAFANSGGSEGITFNVPWSEDFDYNYIETIYNSDGTTSSVKIDPTGWGAKNYTINYNYEETE